MVIGPSYNKHCAGRAKKAVHATRRVSSMQLGGRRVFGDLQEV